MTPQEDHLDIHYDGWPFTEQSINDVPGDGHFDPADHCDVTAEPQHNDGFCDVHSDSRSYAE